MDDSLPNGFLSETCLENSICLPESFEKPILGNQDSEFIIPNEKNHIVLLVNSRSYFDRNSPWTKGWKLALSKVIFSSLDLYIP